ncbi:MAG: hypothetical protein ABH843_07220 [Candidatus Omnitrophota bacterium]
MSMVAMFVGYTIIMTISILMLCSKNAPLPVKWGAGIVIIGSSLFVMVAAFFKFAVKAGYISF